MVNHGTRLQLGIGGQRDRRSAGGAASPEEAAAIVAALERFMRATAAPAPSTSLQGPDRWQRAAILEGVEREWQGVMPDPWLNT